MQPCFVATKPHTSLPAKLQHYLESPFSRSAFYNKVTQRYCYNLGDGVARSTYGLKSALAKSFYPHYKDNRSRRRTKKCNVRGSTRAKGKRVDKELGQYCNPNEKRAVKHNPMTKRIIAEWTRMGHYVVASQVPSLTRIAGRMTQADVITCERATGKLWLWEVKTGMPVGFHLSQGTMSGQLFKDVPCKKVNIWHLQLHYTRSGLTGIIDESRVIHVWEEKNKKVPEVRIYEPPSWLLPGI